MQLISGQARMPGGQAAISAQLRTVPSAQADRRKDVFIATVAHELRNMMAPLMSAIDIIEQAPDDVRMIAQALPVARRQMHHMRHLVDELLDVGRIVNHQVLLEREPLRLQDVVREMLEGCAPMFRSRRQRVSVRMAGQPAWIHGDPVRWAQIVMNLLHNAGKFAADDGEIVVEVSVHGARARLRVQDDGAGIAPAEMERIFAMFQRGSRMPKGAQGLGLGLALVRELVELHGGSIHAESEGLGRGAAFMVCVPLLDHGPAANAQAVGNTPP